MDKDTLKAIEIIRSLLKVLYSGLMYSGDERFIELDKIINDNKENQNEQRRSKKDYSWGIE